MESRKRKRQYPHYLYVITLVILFLGGCATPQGEWIRLPSEEGDIFDEAMTAGASQKISDMTRDTAPTSDDLVMTVNDPDGTPANRAVALEDLYQALDGIIIERDYILDKPTLKC